MSQTFIVHGPAGCGKTYHAERLRAALNCEGVVDEWEPGDPIKHGFLHLTLVSVDDRRCLSFDQALQKAGLNTTATQKGD